MKRCYPALLLATLALVFAGTAFAQKPLGGNTAPTAGPNCDLSNYKSSYQVLTPPLAIPDNLPAGVIVGYIGQSADGTIFDDVILDVQMSHTWLGDVILTLAYFQDCASANPVASTNVLCRQRGTNAGSPPPCGPLTGTFGCSGDLSCNNTYYFSDDALGPMAEGVCATLIPGGCYKPAIGNAMAVFRGLAKGGCFRLSVSDNAAADVGTVCSWSIHTRNTGPVETLTGSWGKLKAIYR